jgi:hypothetical protein
MIKVSIKNKDDKYLAIEGVSNDAMLSRPKKKVFA